MGWVRKLQCTRITISGHHLVGLLHQDPGVNHLLQISQHVAEARHLSWSVFTLDAQQRPQVLILFYTPARAVCLLVDRVSYQEHHPGVLLPAPAAGDNPLDPVTLVQFKLTQYSPAS